MTNRIAIAFQVKEIEDHAFGDESLWQIGIIVNDFVVYPLISARQYKKIDRFVFDSFTDWNIYRREKFYGRN